METDPAKRRDGRMSVRLPRSPGPLARWIWKPRWIPGFILAQVAVLLLFADTPPGTFEGIPGGFGALLSVAAAIVCGPLAGALVSLIGGLVFVPLVTDFAGGTQLSVILWLIAAVGAGVISGMLPGGACRTAFVTSSLTRSVASSRTLAETSRPSSSLTTARAWEAASGASSNVARCSMADMVAGSVRSGNPLEVSVCAGRRGRPRR